MSKDGELADFQKHIEFLSSCCLKHPVDFPFDRITSVVWWSGTAQDSTEYALFRVGRQWGTLIEGADYTGHG